MWPHKDWRIPTENGQNGKLTIQTHHKFKVERFNLPIKEDCKQLINQSRKENRIEGSRCNTRLIAEFARR